MSVSVRTSCRTIIDIHFSLFKKIFSFVAVVPESRTHQSWENIVFVLLPESTVRSIREGSGIFLPIT